METLKVDLKKLAMLLKNHNMGFIDEAEFQGLAGVTVEQAHTILAS